MADRMPCIPAIAFPTAWAAQALGSRPYLCAECGKWHRDYTHRLPPEPLEHRPFAALVTEQEAGPF
jgi:hypothetical protein